MDPESLEKVLELLKQVAAEKEKARTLNQEEKKDLAAMANLLTRSQSELMRLRQIREQEAERYKEQGNERREKEKLDEQRLIDFILKQRRRNRVEVEKEAEEIKKLNLARIGSDRDATGILQDNAANSAKRRVEEYKASSKAIDSIQAAQLAALATYGGDSVSVVKKEAGGMKNLIGEAMRGGMGTNLLVEGLSWLGGEAIDMATKVVEGQASKITNSIKNIIDDLDSQFSSYRKSVGIELPNAHKAFLSVMDTGTELAERWNDSTDSLNSGIKMISDIYIDPSESAAAMGVLTKGVSIFSKTMNETPELGAVMANNVAALSKLGVTQEGTAKAMQLGSKAMGMTGIETIELTRQVVGAGKALDMDLNQAMADFNQMAPELSQFGDKMVDVFAKLEAQSKATGIAAGTLLQTAMRFDTFEGAAKAAGQLNAILGDTVVDTMALIHASPDEKIDMLRDSLSAAGKEFDTMHRREQQVIASSLGVASVAEARQLLNKSNTDAFAEFVDKVDDGKDAFEASDAEIKKLAQTAASITDILGGLASKMAGTMQGATNVIRFTAQKAYDAGTAVADVVGPKYDAISRNHQDAVKKTALESDKAANSIIKDGKRVKQATEKMRGAPPVAKTPVPAKKPEKSPAGIELQVDPKVFKQMKKDVDGLNKSLRGLPSSMVLVAKAMGRLSKIDLSNLKIPDMGLPANLDAFSEIKASPPMMKELSVSSVLKMAEEFGLTAEELKKINPEMLSDMAIKMKASPVKALEPADPIVMPVEVVKDYREEIQRTQSLDRTNYIEKIVEVNKKQEETLQSNTQLIEQLQKLVNVVGERAAVDAAEKFDITLEVGGDQFRTAVKKALGRITE